MISLSEKETMEAGAAFAARLSENDVVCLHGEPGVGKSVFVRGMARALGITDVIASPTFTLVNEYYSGRLPLYHFDMYRLNAALAWDAGLDEYFNSGGICVIEWPEHITDLLPEDSYHIAIARDLSRGDEFRTITVGGGRV